MLTSPNQPPPRTLQPLSAQLDLSPYSLVLAVDVESRTDLLALSDAAWDKGIPLIKVETAGFYGALRTQVKELTGARPLPPLPSIRGTHLVILHN